MYVIIATKLHECTSQIFDAESHSPKRISKIIAMRDSDNDTNMLVTVTFYFINHSGLKLVN